MTKLEASATDLVARLQRRDVTAFEELVRLHQRKVRSFLATMLYDDSAVDDVAQEVFVEAARAIARFKGDASLSTWLVGIARNKAYRHIRTEQRLRRRHTIADAVDLGGAGSGIDQESVERLASCLERLAPRSRSLIEEHYFDGRSVVELAARDMRKESALRMMLMRIRRALRACLEGTPSVDEGPVAT